MSDEATPDESTETSPAEETPDEAVAAPPPAKTPALHKALDRSDDVGAVMASLIGLAGIFDVPAKLGITAEDLAMALGFGFTIMAFVRGRLESRRRAA